MGIRALHAAHFIRTLELRAGRQHQVDEIHYAAVIDIGEHDEIERVDPLERLVPVGRLLRRDIAEEHGSMDILCLDHIVEALGTRSRSHALGQSPTAQVGFVRGDVVMVDAATGAALAIVAGKRSDKGVAVTSHVVIAELVDAADAIADDRRPLRVLGSHVGYQLRIDAARFRGPLERVFLGVFHQARELGHALAAINCEGALKLRLHARRIVGYSALACAVPHEGNLDRGFFTSLFVLHRMRLADNLAGLGVDEERERSMLE